MNIFIMLALLLLLAFLVTGMFYFGTSILIDLIDKKDNKGDE